MGIPVLHPGSRNFRQQTNSRNGKGIINKSWLRFLQFQSAFSRGNRVWTPGLGFAHHSLTWTSVVILRKLSFHRYGYTSGGCRIRLENSNIDRLFLYCGSSLLGTRDIHDCRQHLQSLEMSLEILLNSKYQPRIENFGQGDTIYQSRAQLLAANVGVSISSMLDDLYLVLQGRFLFSRCGIQDHVTNLQTSPRII